MFLLVFENSKNLCQSENESALKDVPHTIVIVQWASKRCSTQDLRFIDRPSARCLNLYKEIIALTH